MRQLYTETRRALSRGLENPVDREDVIKTTKHAAAETLEYRGFSSEELDELWAALGDDYFLRERADDIAWQTEAIEKVHLSSSSRPANPRSATQRKYSFTPRTNPIPSPASVPQSRRWT